ncbi:glycosyltransferase family 4 protein [Salinibacter ruber]|uniref:glycosyltransferase family 4 protein n=1 Tax=Salinibacter ruber TaxID=146919 RepID=UPI001608B9AE|nr:glycosyltransferase family 4 protein [Salinibacter ruber]MBB4091143.1 glycosyltransferase involved in cell wall biosynthesis [Salinibacter ruber]
MSRIAIVGNNGSLVLNFRGDMIQAFLRAGHDVLVCAPGLEGTEVERTLRDWGVDTQDIFLRRQGVNPFSDLRTLTALYRTFRAWGAEAVFSYNAKPVIYGSVAGRLAGARPYAMMTGLGYAFTVSTWRARLVRAMMVALYRVAYESCEAVIFQNPDDRALMRDYGALPASTDTAIVRGSGVDTDHFRPVPLPDRPVFLCAARLLAEKGIREYAEAARRVKGHHPEARFLLAGGIDDVVPNSVTRNELEGWEQKGTIEYLGYLDDVRAGLAEASIYVLPSYREGTPRSVLEALSMRRPVLTTDVAGCRETVEPGENGWLVPPRTVDDLAEAMNWMIEHPERWGEMGRASRQLALKRFDVEVINKSIMEVMDLSPSSMAVGA